MTVVGLGSCLALGADADLVQTPELVSGQPVTQVPMGPAGGGVAVVERTLLLELDPTLSSARRAELLESYGLRLERDQMPGGWIKARTAEPAEIDRLLRRHGRPVAHPTDPGALRALLELLLDDPRVRAGSPNSICAATAIDIPPDDDYYDHQWNLPQIGMEEAWTHRIRRNQGIVIGVLDTGFSLKNGDPTEPGHRDLSKRALRDVPGYDFVDDDGVPADSNAHGTHVASTVFAKTDNGRGIAAICHKLNLCPVRILDENGNGTLEHLVDGIEWIIDCDANGKVINMSLAFPSGYEPGAYLAQAIARADSAGVILVASTGNEGLPVVPYPAAYNEVIAVGAADRYGNRAPYSNYGAALDLVAPGGVEEDADADGYPDGILGATFAYQTPDDPGYWFAVGTSHAAPHVAGVAGMVLSDCHRTEDGRVLTPLEVRNIVLKTARNLGDAGWDPITGYGLVSASQALDSWASVEIERAHQLGGYVTDYAAVPRHYPPTMVGVIAMLPEGLVLFLETDEGLFCFRDAGPDLVEAWLLTETDLSTLMDADGGLIQAIADAGGLLAMLDANGGLLATLDANGGLLAMLDANGGLLAMLDANGGLLAMIDANGGFLAMLDANGGLLAMLDANGGFLAMLDANGGLLAMLDANGGMLARLDAEGAIIDCMTIEGESLDGCSSLQNWAMSFLADGDPAD